LISYQSDFDNENAISSFILTISFTDSKIILFIIASMHNMQRLAGDYYS